MDEAPFHRDVAEGPRDMKAFWVFAEDGVRLRIVSWHPETAAKGTILLLQGRTENVEKYGRTAENLVAAGYAVLALDWRGQGLSDRLAKDRMLGHVTRFSDYQKDLAAMIEAGAALGLARPWYLLGHSMGACIGLRALAGALPVRAAAFTSPLWEINLPWVKRLAAWPLSWAARVLGQGHRYAPGTRGESYVLSTPFEDNRLTQDPDMYRYYIRISEQLDDQQIGGPSMRWLFETLKETRDLARLPSPSTPCLTFCGSEDSVISTAAVRDRMSRWPEGRLEMIPGGRHDLLYERPEIRGRVIAEICAFFDSHKG